MGRRDWTGLLAVAAVLLVPAGAQGAITGSTITAPKSPRFLLNNEDTGGTKLTVKGRTSGGNPAVDQVDLVCFQGTAHTELDDNVPLASNGRFSVSENLTPINASLCQLRALPAGTIPANVSPFKGPILGIGNRRTSTISGGPNDGRVRDFYIYATQREAAFDYDSLFGCGIDDGYLLDSTLDYST